MMSKTLNRLLKIFWLIIIFSYNFNYLPAESYDTVIIKKSDTLEVKFFNDNDYILGMSGNIELEYSGITINSDSITFNPVTSQISSNSVTRFKSSDLDIVTDKFNYYLNYDINELYNVSLVFDKWFIKAGKLQIKKNIKNSKQSNFYTLTDARITSCDFDTPHFHIFSKKSLLKPDESISLYSPVFKIGKFPLLYFPYLKKRLGRDVFKYEAGYSKREGIFALTEYFADPSPPLTYSIIADYYYYRGIGTGFNAKYDTSNIFISGKSYYIAEKPIIYNINTGEYLKTGGTRRDRWKTEFDIKSIIYKNINIRGTNKYYSDNLIEKDYKERWSGLIINEFNNEFEISSITENKVWHLIYERKDLWNAAAGKFKYSYINFPDLRIMWNRKHFKKLDIYFKPDISVISKHSENSVRNTDYNAAGYLIKKININKLLNFSITAGLKFNRNEYSSSEISRDHNKLNYTAEISRLDNYKNYYSYASHSFEKIFYNVNSTQDFFTSVLTNKLNWDNMLIFDKSMLSLISGVSLNNNKYYSNAKERFEDVKINYLIEFDSGSSLSASADYSIKKSAVSISSLTHIFNSKNNKFSLTNGLNYVNKNNVDGIYQWTSDFTYNIFKEKTAEWVINLSQTVDLNSRYLKTQNIKIIKDLHCFTSELSYNKASKNDYSIFLVFNIKSYPKQGLGIQYNYANKSIRLKQ